MSNKDKALAALISSSTLREAANKCGLSERTLNGYIREDKDFREAYNEARQGIIREAAEKMTNACTQAADTLAEIVTDKEASHACRIQAAKAILEHGAKLWEIVDICERLEAIETRISSNEN